MKLLLSCLVLEALSSWVSTTEAYFSASVSTSLVSLITGQWSSSGIEIFLWRNGAEYKLVDLVKNGSFQSGLADWQHYGNVRSISQSCCGNQTAIAILGNDPAQEQFELAVLSQQLPAHSYPLVVSFWYKLITSEDLQLFDSPAMIVEINGIPRFQAFANEAKNKRGDLQESEWRFITLGLPPSPEEGSSIKIIQGNTGDNKKTTQVFVSGISTISPQIKSNDKVVLRSYPSGMDISAAVQNLLVPTEIFLADGEGEIIIPAEDLFILSKIKYGKYEHEEIVIHKDVSPPKKPDSNKFNFHVGVDNQAVLEFIIPEDSGGGFIETVEAVARDSEGQTWELQPNKTGYPRSLGIGAPLPFVRPPGSRQLLVFNPENVESVAISAIDQAGNVSELSEWFDLPKITP